MSLMIPLPNGDQLWDVAKVAEYLRLTESAVNQRMYAKSVPEGDRLPHPVGAVKASDLLFPDFPVLGKVWTHQQQRKTELDRQWFQQLLVRSGGRGIALRLWLKSEIVEHGRRRGDRD